MNKFIKWYRSNYYPFWLGVLIFISVTCLALAVWKAEQARASAEFWHEEYQKLVKDK